MADSGWNKATVVNSTIAAGHRSPGRTNANGIQGDHFLPQQQPSVQRHSFPAPVQNDLQNQSSSTVKLLTKDWATSNQVSYGLANKNIQIDTNLRAGRPTAPETLQKTSVLGRNEPLGRSGKRTVI